MKHSISLFFNDLLLPKKISFFILLFFPLILFGQADTEKQYNFNFFPPSPSVSAIMRFEEIPVDFYSGQPNISVPLFNKKITGNLSYSLSLNYSTTGTRIDEISGWTGTGWSLNGTPVISRTVRGYADEVNHPQEPGIPYGENYLVGVYHNGFFDIDLSLDSSSYYTYETQRFIWNSMGRGSIKWPDEGAFDKELDLYQISVFGLNDRFVIMKEGNTLNAKMLTNDSNLKIEVDHDENFHINSFIVWDTNSIKYIFDVKEISETTSTSIGVLQNNATMDLSPGSVFKMEYVSSWKLRQVKHSNDQLLASFDYQDVFESMTNPISEKYATHFPSQNPGSSDDPFGDINSSVGVSGQCQQYNSSIALPKYSKSINYQDIQSKKLERINFNDGSFIQFFISDQLIHPEYKNNSGSILSQIDIVDQENGSFNKRFNFNYQTTNNNRLFLTAVDEKGQNGSELSTLLKYNNKEGLPQFGSIKKDIWGYFKEDDSFRPYGYRVPLKSADKYNVSIGVLEEIIYPAGGVKKFIFESNTFSNRGSVEFSDDEFKALNKDNWILKNVEEEFTNEGLDLEKPIGDTFYIQGTWNPQENMSTQEISYEVITNGNQNDIDNARIRIKGISDPSYDNVLELNSNSILQIPEGEYKLFLQEPSANSTETFSGTVKLYYKDFNPSLVKHIYGGGVRIKEIEFYDTKQASIPSQKYSYNYQLQENINKSSGSIDGFLSNYKEYNEPIAVISASEQSYGNGVGCHPTGTYLANGFPAFDTWSVANSGFIFKVREFINAVYATTKSGNYVGYKNVEVIFPENGKKIYNYTTPLDYNSHSENYGWPFIPYPEKTHLQGLLLEEKNEDIDGNLIRKESFEHNTQNPIEVVQMESNYLYDRGCAWMQIYDTYEAYRNKTPDNFDAVNALEINQNDFRDNCINSPLVEDAYVYNYQHDFGYQLKKVLPVTNESISYLDNNEVKRSTFFQEYNMNNFLPTKVTTTTSESNQTLVAKTKYAHDMPVSEPQRDALIAANRIAEPIQTETYIADSNGANEQLLSTQKTQYANFDGLILPKFIRSLKSNQSSSTPKTRIIYHSYDSYGNPTEVSQADGTRISYIWGYNGQYPVAKIENKSYTSIPSSLRNNIINATPSQMQSRLLALRNHSSTANTMISTYIYKPLVGITSMTDPRGYSMTYHYDDLNRLKYIKDEDGNILSKNEYNYKNN